VCLPEKRFPVVPGRAPAKPDVRPLIIDLGRDYRGGQQQALLLLQGLRAAGHEPHLLTVAGSGLAKDAHLAGIPTKEVPAASRQIRSAGAVRELLAEHRADIVHANEPHALTASWLARVHRKVPLVVSRRVIFPLSRSPISLARYRACARIIAVSQSVANALLVSGLSEDRVVVIADGVRVPQMPTGEPAEIKAAARKKLDIPSEVPLIGNVAAFTPDKGQDLLVHTLVLLRSAFSECQLLLAGEGPSRQKVEGLVAEHRLEGAVHFVGYVDDISTVYRALDVFAFPAQAEALGTAMLLAMAHGLPVVALARGGVPEAISDGHNGRLIEEADTQKLPRAIADAIGSILSSPEQSRRFGQNAHETICERFSVDRMVQGTLELYESLAASSKKRSIRFSNGK
jgi:glycosyltransferase involved in cell wall biosynthesis